MHMTVYNFTINYEIRHAKETKRKRLYCGEYTIAEGGEHTERGKRRGSTGRGESHVITMTKQNDTK